MTDWLTANSAIAYPFRDEVAYDDDLSRIADANIALNQADTLTYLRDIDTVGESLVIIDADDQVVVDSANGTYSTTVFGTYTIIKVVDAVNRTSAELTILSGEVINQYGLKLPFATQAHDFKAATLYSINGANNTPVIELGEDFTVEESAGEIVINLAEPEDRVDFPATPYLFTINNITPSRDGQFWIQPAASAPCHRVDSQAIEHRIQLRNICKACCQCNDYYATYLKMQGLDDLVADAIVRASALRTRYHILVNSFNDYMENPPTSPTGGGSGVARTWVGHANPARALNILARFYPSNYGGTITVNAVNSLEVDISSLTIAVSGPSLSPQGGVIQGSATQPSSEFGGFPGTANISGLKSMAAATASGFCYDSTRAVRSAAFTITVTAVTVPRVVGQESNGDDIIADYGTLNASLSVSGPLTVGLNMDRN